MPEDYITEKEQEAEIMADALLRALKRHNAEKANENRPPDQGEDFRQE